MKMEKTYENSKINVENLTQKRKIKKEIIKI